MAFIDGNDVIQQVAAAAADPALRDAILPGAFEGSLNRIYLQGLNGCRDLQSVLCITIEDEKAGSRIKRKRLSQLLDDPQARRMLGDVEVQDAPAVMGDDEKTVEHTESDRRHSEKVHRRNGFPVVAQESEPTFAGLRISRCSAHPAGDGSFGNIETEHQKLTVNTRRSPGWVFRSHLEDQIANFPGNSSSADDPAGSGDGPPIQPESRSVPPYDRLRTHDKKSLFPSGPEPSRQNPEELIGGCQPWPGMSALQCCELLAKNQVFNEQRAAGAKKAKKGTYE